MICSNCKKIIAESSTKCPFCGTNCLQKSVKNESKHKNIKKFVLIALALAVFGIAIVVFMKYYYVQTSIKIHVANNQKDIIRLADYTPFDWDKVMVFKWPTGASDVERELGVECHISRYAFDLSSGIIFVKDNKIIHYEIFAIDYNKGAKFTIYPVADLYDFTDQRVFQKEDAVFSTSCFGRSDGSLGYTLYPLN